ncbi:hypothetical protein [Microlunatus parietis]|uniref:Uncharacterized protein n=1 Tax=Microlunatus parietis TaxID=682979 RepID=A0A7Y9IE53_9ACTN|nr:hypothetical protein [Microlunatus parietis]NYE75266.1 hypothetical protein [Microlunatus parietis]
MIIPNKITTFQVDLALRASVVLPVLCREDKVAARAIVSGAVCVADSGADMGAPAASHVSYGPRTSVTIPAPASPVMIGGPVTGLRVSAGMTHQLSNRGKAATKPTHLGRSSCSPPV